MVNPSNAELGRQIREIQYDDAEMLQMIKDHEARLRLLENWKIAYDAAMKALENGGPRRAASLDKEFLNAILKIISLLTAIVGLIYLIVERVLK